MPHLGLDISNHQGELSPETAACLADGNGLVIVRASLERKRLVDIARQQMRALQPHVLVHGYIWMYPSWDPLKTVNDAIREYGRFALPWYWIDAEETGDVADPARNAYWLRAALDALKGNGVRAGIYTGAWWWNDRRNMNGSTEFRETPLWYAEYDGVPDLHRWTPFGGWVNPGGKQYHTTAPLCGIPQIDRDVFADWVVNPEPPPPPEPDFRALLEAELRGQLVGIADDRLRLDVREQTVREKLGNLGVSV